MTYESVAHPVMEISDYLLTRDVSSRKLIVLLYTAIFAKNMRNSTVNYLIPDWLTAVT